VGKNASDRQKARVGHAECANNKLAPLLAPGAQVETSSHSLSFQNIYVLQGTVLDGDLLSEFE
jgi:hypothetical protein